MSHTQLDYQLAFGFYSNFPTSILISISWYSPGVLPWMEFYTIRTRYSLRHRFKDRLSIQKEYFKFLVQITLKIDGIFLARSEHCRYTRFPKDGNRRVGLPTSRFAYTHANRFAYMIWRIVSVIRCPCVTFNSVRRRIYGGVTWGSVIDQSAKWEATFIFHFYARSCSVPFLNCLNLHNFRLFHSAK